MASRRQERGVKMKRYPMRVLACLFCVLLIGALGCAEKKMLPKQAYVEGEQAADAEQAEGAVEAARPAVSGPAAEAPAAAKMPSRGEGIDAVAAQAEAAKQAEAIAAVEKAAAEKAAAEKAAAEKAAAEKAAEPLPQVPAAATAAAAPAAAALPAEITWEDVRFDFDKYTLKPEGRTLLDRLGDWLLKNKAYVVVIEGHCDERGTVEYNLALGERRAEEARKYLVDLGVEAGRIKTISYGKEMPLDPGHNEEAWATNRRDHFVVQVPR